MTLPFTPGGIHCITQFKIEAKTGSERYSGFSSVNMNGKTHHIQLILKNGKVLVGDIKSPAYRGYPYSLEINLPIGGLCVSPADITQVKLKAGGNDGWKIESITTYAKDGAGTYVELTSDPTFNKWLDGNERYPYNAKEHILTMKFLIDTPRCGYGISVCECRDVASTCVFNLEIDEIMTFTSYQKISVGEGEGMFVRGTQGVIFNIDEKTGKEKSLEGHKGRKCADRSNTECSDPQFVDGKTYRMAIGVNGQIPGPTFIVHDGQKVIIHVHNNLSTEGVSIHWHGMFQMGTPWMDGVGQVTQCQIGPSSSFNYIYKASPSGTFWYHSHSGAQRTDGFFGALIVKERPEHYKDVKKILSQDHGVADFEDLPGEHTLTLLDWQHEASLATFAQLFAGLGFYPGKDIGDVPEKHDRYKPTKSFERASVGPVPYFSGLINGKGRHSDVPYSKTRLSIFTVEKGKRYRFRLVGTQGLYAYKFSIDGHKLTVVGTDGYWIEPVKDVNYIIIHTGERYDFILEANAAIKDYWIRVETLEIDPNGASPPYKSLGHVAEGILQYKRRGVNARKIPSTEYETIKRNSVAHLCRSNERCKAVNCPFENFHRNYYTQCINVRNLRLLIKTPQNEMPHATPTCSNGCTHFINFNFEGDSETSSVNGRNFILPPAPPQTQNDDFQKQAIKCNLSEICNPYSIDCMCTHMIDIPYQQTIQLVLSALGPYDNAHPIHLHGHTFHVVKVGYPEYDAATGFIKKKMENGKQVSVHNPDIACDDKTSCKEKECKPQRCTRPRWANGRPIMTINRQTIRKDTVMLPAGGYVVINFKSDNPGHWFLHCHIEVHQLEGMAVIVNEAFDQQQKLKVPKTMNKCGDFTLSMAEYKKILYTNSQLALMEESEPLEQEYPWQYLS